MSENEQTLKDEIARLKEALDQERQKQRRGVHLKVSEKGGVSLYGIRRFPITFYGDEWLRILDMEDQIRIFLDANADSLAKKKR